MFPTNDPMEIIANVSNPMLDARVDVVQAGPAYPGQYRIVGSFFHRYPIGYAKATADIYIGLNKVASVNLLDDGTLGVDDQALDGTYAALFNPAQYDLSDKRPKARVDVTSPPPRNRNLHRAPCTKSVPIWQNWQRTIARRPNISSPPLPPPT